MRLLFGECHLQRRVRGHSFGDRGFTLIELLLGMTILAVGLLSIATMFPTGYTDVTGGGKTTMAAAAARQILEDAHTLPFQSLIALHQFDTNNSGSQPPVVDENANPGGATARDIARKWRYAIAGESDAWAFTSAEKKRWRPLSISTTPVPFGGRGQITVDSPSASLRRITVTISIPGRGVNLRLATVISNL